MLIGYARVSTHEQNLDLQNDALKAAGCERIFTDTASGAKTDRPGLTSALELCRKEDTLVVWKLDRLGRSLPHLVETVRDLVDKGVGFKSLQEIIDTTTSGGKLIFHIFASLAEFERDIITKRGWRQLVPVGARVAAPRGSWMLTSRRQRWHSRTTPAARWRRYARFWGYAATPTTSTFGQKKMFS